MNGLFIASLAVLIGGNLWWGIKTLPREGWQILATVPSRRSADGTWQGINFTYYGLFSANAYMLAVLLFLLLMRSTGARMEMILAAILCLIGCCTPASRLIARLVEKKAATFTVGGASFFGLLLAPPLFLALDQLSRALFSQGFNVMAGLAALVLAYALGEGLGRLACISFGCCYGKRIEACGPLMRRIFQRHHVSYEGQLKKVAYEGNLAGQPLVPVQAMTCGLYTGAALLGSYLFLRGSFIAAYLSTLLITQLWRVASEFLRADFRGAGRFSAYQLMALAAVVYGSLAACFLADSGGAAVIDLGRAWPELWSPAALLFLQTGWLTIFIYTGKSAVTGSRISFHVNHHLT